MDTFLKIWAIAGPILVAGISAIWLRRTQLQDRAHELSQHQKARREALEDDLKAFHREISESDKNELRNLAGQFLYRAGEFVDCHIQLCLREPPQGITQKCDSSREEFNKISHQFALIAPEELSKATIHMQNCAAEFLFAHKLDQEKINELGEKYKAAKASFMNEAKKLLASRLIEA